MKILYLNKRDVQPEHGKTKPFEFKTEDIERAEVVDGFLGTKHGYKCYLKLPEKKKILLKFRLEMAIEMITVCWRAHGIHNCGRLFLSRPFAFTRFGFSCVVKF